MSYKELHKVKFFRLDSAQKNIFSRKKAHTLFSPYGIMILEEWPLLCLGWLRQPERTDWWHGVIHSCGMFTLSSVVCPPSEVSICLCSWIPSSPVYCLEESLESTQLLTPYFSHLHLPCLPEPDIFAQIKPFVSPTLEVSNQTLLPSAFAPSHAQRVESHTVIRRKALMVKAGSVSHLSWEPHLGSFTNLHPASSSSVLCQHLVFHSP